MSEKTKLMNEFFIVGVTHNYVGEGIFYNFRGLGEGSCKKLYFHTFLGPIVYLWLKC